MIGDVIKCKRCAAIDEYEWTRQAEFHLRAMLVLRFAMQRNPNREAADKILAQCAVQLARAHTEIGDNLTFGEAIAKLKDRVAGEPDNPDWRQRLGNSYFHSRQHTLALATYAELLARWPPYSDGWLMRGQLYARLDRHEEALNDYIQAALTLDPKAAKAPEYATSLRFALLEEALAAGKPVPVEALAALSHIKSEEEAEEQAPPRFAGRRDEADSDEDDYYEDEDAARPVAPLRAKAVQVGPNDRCPCGSGKKYKKCCGR
jgi:tetratricopeptide (TPR) repeat protein